MPVEEPRRIALHRAAADSWGEEVADTLVELVTPAGHEMATRADIQTVLTAMDAMDQRWDERIAALDERWDERLSAMDDRISAMDERWDQRLEATEQRLTAAFERGLREAITSQTRLIVVSLLVAIVTITGTAIGLAIGVA
jgi:hypothetical protein